MEAGSGWRLRNPIKTTCGVGAPLVNEGTLWMKDRTRDVLGYSLKCRFTPNSKKYTGAHTSTDAPPWLEFIWRCVLVVWLLFTSGSLFIETVTLENPQAIGSSGLTERRPACWQQSLDYVEKQQRRNGNDGIGLHNIFVHHYGHHGDDRCCQYDPTNRLLWMSS